MACDVCSVTKGSIILEDNIAFTFLSPQPAAKGHIIIAPKEHRAILEDTPDEVLVHMVMVANKLSTALFEGLGAQGTNILINNGLPAGQTEPHMTMHVIPRYENDGIDLAWEGKKADDAELDVFVQKLSDALSVDTKEELPVPDTTATPEEDYRINNLTRIP